MSKKFSANSIYFIYTGASALLFSIAFTLNGVFRVEVIGLNALQLILVGTVLETAAFVFEIPTGIVADVFSRKLSVIIGLIIIGIGISVEGIFPVFAVSILSQLLWGLGYTFTSGADDAWIADEIQGKNLEKTFMRAAQINQICALAGIGISVALGSFGLSLPIITGGALFVILAIFLMYYMPEKNFKPTVPEDKDTWGKMWHVFGEGLKTVRKSSILIIILCIAALYGLSSEGFDRLWTKHLLDNFTFPQFTGFTIEIWFGIINSASMVLSIIAVEIIRRRFENSGKVTMVWLLMAINVVLAASVILFGLAGNFTMALITYWSSTIMRRSNGPIFSAWINQNVESSVRATIISMQGQVDALGQIIGGPIIGIIAAKSSVSIGIACTGAVLSPIIILYLVAVKRQKLAK